MKTERIITLLLAVCLPLITLAQKLDNNWCFAWNRGINFGSITAFNSSIIAQENCATASDYTTGGLLFYTNGVNVWDCNNNIMPNGSKIAFDTTYTSAQGCVVARNIIDTNKYFIFTVEPNSGIRNTRSRLFYSVVDMKLNGGFGDVVSTQKTVYIMDSLSESMTIVSGKCCIWLLTHSILSDKFYAFKITTTGLNPNPVISTGGYAYKQNGVGYIKVSPDNKKLALSSVQSPVLGSFVALHDFDINTGIVSNGMIIDTLKGDLIQAYFYSLEFSPNSSKLFMNMRGPRIFQYDISLPTASAITASKQNISASGISNGIQLGPDNNLYVAGGDMFALGRILNPDLTPPACSFSSILPFSVFDPYGTNILGLPQKVGYALLNKESGLQNINTCFGEPVILKSPAGAISCIWQDGSHTLNDTVSTSGIYWVRSVLDCSIRTDSFIVTDNNFNFDLGNDTIICTGQHLSFKFNIPNASYKWQDSSTANTYTINKAGHYSLTINVNGCSKTDDINVTESFVPPISLGNDTALCPNSVYTLAVPDSFTSYMWSNGNTSHAIDVKQAGKYWVKVYNGTCYTSDTIYIGFPITVINFGRDELLCTGETLVLKGESFPGSSYLWQDGSTNIEYTVTTAGRYWVKATNACGEFGDTINVNYENCECTPFVPSAFSPNNDGRNDRIKPILNCNISKYSFIIANRWGQIVFNSADPTQKWDGIFNNQLCDVGTYYYLLRLTGPRNKEFLFKGDITLIR